MVRHDTLKHCIWCFKMENFVGYLHFSVVTENRCMVVVFFYYHLKSAFSKHECNKTLTETCICFHEYLKQTIKLKNKHILACFLGRIPFPIKIIHSTMSKLQKQYIEMTQCCLIYMNPALPTSIMILKYVSPPGLV